MYREVSIQHQVLYYSQNKLKLDSIHQCRIALLAKHTYAKNKQTKKPLFLQKKRKIYRLDFPSVLPKVSLWRRNNTCRKWAGMFGKHLVDQYARQERGREADRQRGRERVRRRDTQSPGEREVFGEQPVLFKSTVTLLSPGKNIQLSSFLNPSELNTARLCGVRRGELWVMSLVSPRGRGHLSYLITDSYFRPLWDCGGFQIHWDGTTVWPKCWYLVLKLSFQSTESTHQYAFDC